MRPTTRVVGERPAPALERGRPAVDEVDEAGRLRAVAARVARRPAALVVVLALGAGTWAVVGSSQVFPHLSDDHDEGLYLLQAHALAAGHLFPPAPRHPEFFIPWLSALTEDRFVLKYSPVHASLLAVGVKVVGSPRWSLGLIAAGVVVLSYLLAKEVLGDKRLAALASVFLTLSPLFLLMSATFLPYCSSLLLLEAFAFTLLRGMRTNRRLFLGGSGLLFGVALFARPFDALLFALPLGLYFVFTHRNDLSRLGANGGWFALGAVLPVVAMLAYYRAATGSPFRSPFNFLEPLDTLGFGPRKLLPGQPPLLFRPAEGWYGLGRHLFLTSFWGFGGLVLVGLFLAGLLRRRIHGPEPWVALGAFTFSCGFAFFWGTYGMGLRGSLSSLLGPFYFLPVLVPLTVLAAKGFGGLWRWDRAVAVMAFLGMLAVSGYLLNKAVSVNQRLTREDRRVYAPLANADFDHALVLLPPIWGHHLLHPFASLRNAPHYDGETVYALDRGDEENLRLVRDFPDRSTYRFKLHGHYRANPTDPKLRTALEPLRVVEGSAVATRLGFRNPTAHPHVVVSVTLRGAKHSFVLDSRSQAGKPYEAGLVIGPDSVGVSGPAEVHTTEPVGYHTSILVSVSTGPGPGQAVQPLYERRLAYTIEGQSLRVLVPGGVTINELGPDPLADLTAASPPGSAFGAAVRHAVAGG